MGKDRRQKNYRNKHGNPYSKKDMRNPNKKHEYPQRTGGGHQRTTGNRQTYNLPKVSLLENQVGVTEFTSDCAGFTGILKSRFSDFHVNEIDTNGKVLILNDLKVPHPEEKTKLVISEEELDNERKELESMMVTPDIWKQIEELAATKYDAEKKQTIEIDVTTLNKEQRTQIHNVFKKCYEYKLVSTTVTEKSTDDEGVAAEKKLIRIMKPKNKRDQQHFRWTFPGEFVHFLIHKENMDTSEAAGILAERLNLRPSQVNYCGTKDKRGKTTQKFCIKKRLPSQILSATRSVRNMHIGNFEFSNEVLKLGNLKGNRFRVVLRHITDDKSQIESALNALNERGFINYYGLQRFGNCVSIPTYEVGIALLKSDYKLACELILKPRDNDVNFMREIRAEWWEKRDSAAAAAMFRGGCSKSIEKKLLDGLAQYGENDYSGALRKIPRNMLLLYAHAYQSLIFNRVASRRVKEFGLKLIPGDLVYRNKEEEDMADVEISDDIENTSQNDTQEVTDSESESVYKKMVKPLTEGDIASGNYTIFDVVLALPGYDVTYPDNESGRWYEEILNESDLSSEKLKHNVKTYALGGAYRKLLVQPKELKWHFRKYSKHDDTLLASDWEQLHKFELPKEPEDNDETSFTALIMEFSLPTSVYATMLLRELLKLDTSAMRQTQLQFNELKKSEVVATNQSTSINEKNTTDQSSSTTESNTPEIINIDQSASINEEETDAATPIDSAETTAEKRKGDEIDNDQESIHEKKLKTNVT